jgi:hypothetical protein
MRKGSYSLREFHLDVVRLDCPQCGRSGRYRRDGLLARFGPDIALPDLLGKLVECEHRVGLTRNCRARFADLVRP